MKLIEISRERKALIIFLAILLIGFLYMMKPFLMPMMLASIITVLIYPLHSKIERSFGNRRHLSALVSSLLVFFVIILPSTWVGAVLINQLYGIIGNLDLKSTFSNLFSAEFYVQYIEPFIQDIEQTYNVKINLFGVLTNFGKQVAKYIYSYSPSVLLGTANFIMAFFIMMVGLFFLLIEGANLLKIFLDVSPLRETHERRLFRKVKETIDASIYGYLVTGLVQGIIAGIIYAIVGLEGFVVLGTLTFFMSMVPVVGAAGVWVPVCIWLFLQGYTWQGFVVLIGGAAIISAIDNFLKPIIIEGKAKIHPLLIFFSLFGGIQLFGPLGILFGPVVTALLIATINIYREEIV